MSLKINENPTISDTVLLEIKTPDSNGCFLNDPYRVDSVTIYYVQRDFSKGNYGTADISISDETAMSEYTTAKETACEDPSEENLQALQSAQEKLTLLTINDTLYFHDVKIVAQIGTESLPAWLSTDANNALIQQVTEDDNGNPVFGYFQYEWKPLGMREGDYLMVVTWTPLISGETLSSSQHFTLLGDTQITTSIPTHRTKEGKYETLMERYMPEMFKSYISDNDLSPLVLQELNNSVAKGFTFIEDMANQSVDLIDANSTHESLLNLLGNMFGLKLHTNDPTMWRRQIKRAMPVFKKKGTLSGLSEALAQSGIRLKKFTRLWQLMSRYTWQEDFTVTDVNNLTFDLSKAPITPIDPSNTEVYYRGIDDDEWTTLVSDYVSIDSSSVTWIGNYMSVNPITLALGDSFRVVYQILSVPTVNEQTLEDYVRTLPLMDQRDERLQDYPPKNWNIRLIEEDDPLIDVLIPTKNPYQNNIVYGMIRTEFPYSENVYNMEEYNGSTRESENPCDIDKSFIDQCSQGLSSKFNVDLEIEQLSDDRLSEAQEIINEYKPFHATMHSMILEGGINEFIEPAQEEISMLVQYVKSETTVVDPPETIFNRAMLPSSQFKRDALADVSSVSAGTGTIQNNHVVIFSPDVKIDKVGLDNNPDLTFMEILSPSVNAGSYTITNADGNVAEIYGSLPSEPLDESAFTFRLSNEVIRKSTTSISQSDYSNFGDDDLDVSDIKTQWDVDNTTYPGQAWKVSIPTYGSSYKILHQLPDGSLEIEGDISLPTTNVDSLTYSILDDNSIEQSNSNTGWINVKRRGIVDLSGGTILIRGGSANADDVENMRNIIKVGNYLLYSGTQYTIDFVNNETHKIYINNYEGGDVSGVVVLIYERLINNQIGYLKYTGTTLTCLSNYESLLNIVNGSNPPSEDNVLEDNRFKENFLILIDTSYYAISDIDSNVITLNGPLYNWTTTGTSTSFEVLKFTKQPAGIPERVQTFTPGHDFDLLDRRGNEVFEIDIDNDFSELALAESLNSANRGQTLDLMRHNEKITYSIERRENV